MKRLATGLQRGWGSVWWWLRQVSGDARYENYLRRAGAVAAAHRSGQARHAGPALSREEFYLEMVQRKYAGVSRCC